MLRIEGPTVNPDRADLGVAELLSGPDGVAVRAEAADVVVGVWAILAQGDDVVGHRRSGDDPFGVAVPAQGLGGEAALALLYASAASEALGALGGDVVRTTGDDDLPSGGPNNSSMRRSRRYFSKKVGLDLSGVRAVAVS